jgi:hypothetical protein
MDDLGGEAKEGEAAATLNRGAKMVGGAIPFVRFKGTREGEGEG